LDIQRNQLGNPNFQIDDIQLFLLPMRESNADMAFPLLNTFIECFLREENVTLVGGNNLVALRADPPATTFTTNFDQTLSTCIMRESTQTFMASDLNGDADADNFALNAVGVAFTLVPDPASASVGTAPAFADGAMGPVLANGLFPVSVTTVLRDADNPMNSTDLAPGSAAQALNTLTDPSTMAPFAFDGYSHLPIFTVGLYTRIDAITGVPVSWLTPTDATGRYELVVTISAQGGSGWEFTIPFEVQ